MKIVSQWTQTNIAPENEARETDDIVKRAITREEVTKRLNRHRHVINQYWTCWKQDYFTSLREHQRTDGTTNQMIREGDVVIVQGDFAPRLRWNLGVIHSLITGNDGFSRDAHVKKQMDY